MKIKVNNEVLVLANEENIAELMQMLYSNNTNGKAVAIDNKVVPMSAWETTKIKENDNILIITATQGG